MQLMVHLGKYMHTYGYRIIAMVLRCFTEDHKTLHINLDYPLSTLQSPWELEWTGTDTPT